MTNSEQKRRVSEILKEYWDSLCKDGVIPREGDVDFASLDAVIDHTFMIEVLAKTEDERFKHCFLGPAITLAYGANETAEEVYDQLVGTYREQLQMKLECVLESAKSLDEDSEFVNSSGLLIRYRQSLFPLRGNTTDAVEYVLGCLTWRGYKVFNRKDNKQFFSGEPIDDRENVFSSPPPPAPVIKKGPPPPAPPKKKA